MKRLFGLILLISLVTATSACHSARIEHGMRAEPPTSFSDLWRLYMHCRTTHDPGILILDAAQLSRIALTDQETLPRLLRPLWPLIEDQPVRLAVDPREMVVDCTLRAGQAAAEAGWYDVAIKLYRSIILRHSDAPYAYYRSQAKARLAQLLEQASIAPSHSDSSVQAERQPSGLSQDR